MACVLPPCAIVGGIGHCLGSCAHLACIITTAVFRFSSYSNECAKVGAPVYISDDGEITTFEDHGASIQSLFIAQCVLLCFYGCCISTTTQMGMGIYAMKKGMGAMARA